MNGVGRVLIGPDEVAVGDVPQLVSFVNDASGGVLGDQPAAGRRFVGGVVEIDHRGGEPTPRRLARGLERQRILLGHGRAPV